MGSTRCSSKNPKPQPHSRATSHLGSLVIYPASGQLSSSPPPYTNPPVIAHQHQTSSAQGAWLPPGSAPDFASGLSPVSSLHSALPPLYYKPPPGPPPGHFSTPLPAPWSQRFDTASGRLYYENSQTGQVTWEKPAVSAHSVAPQHTFSAAEHPAHSVHAHHQPQKAGAYFAPTAHQQQHAALGGQRPLPPGWTETRMPDGRPLYRNEMQQRSSYERPQ